MGLIFSCNQITFVKVVDPGVPSKRAYRAVILLGQYQGAPPLIQLKSMFDTVLE